jgi:la-related protein 1
MDSRGWIPISLIASFNRVKKLTLDANLVKEVLYLSSMVQVRDEWVRMGGWERFVLPDAEESVAPEFDQGVNLNHPPYPMLNGVYVGVPTPPVMFGLGAPSPPAESRSKAAPNGVVSNGDSVSGTEDEEDDVVFVYKSEVA